MCFHASTPKKEKVAATLGDEYTIKDYESYYHTTGFAHPNLPVALNIEPKVIQPVSWGLIPSWVKDQQSANDISNKTLNAKSETIFSLPSFRDSIVKKRCLIFVDGFYEWEHQGKETLPYYIYMAENKPFALGGIWSEWTNRETGEIMTTCSIITTDANQLMSKIHNTKKRMPLILENSQWKSWLAPDTTKETLEQEMKPLSDGILKAHRISKLITSRTADSNVPEVQTEFMDSLF
jgi:putative SOS response-associated peptidase YedK